MSNSDLFLIKNEEEDMSNFEIVKRPTLNIQTESSESHSESSKNSHNNISEDKKEENSDNHIHKIIEECFIVSKEVDSESRTRSLEEGKLREVVEEDGFRTPTSLDHRISVTIVCPAAPRKNKSSLKRRTPYNHCRNPLDLSKEVELLFPTSDHSYQSKKKVRREESK